MSQHWVQFVQLFHAAQQLALFLDLRRLRILDLQLRNLHHELFAARQELMQRRIVTGKPSMALKTPSKSERCIGSSLAISALRSASVRARIMFRMCPMRSS